ncbi:Gfo/Idh/MocA family protein [Micromonospora sp. NBC_01813]|uniref:Gfo/Idh/MocA family protein n=1 Tax=Micromonospora sp. NBC_01813 TaxID=2975988 RepID=UPI002DD97B15|nr:Gfo/Idh/MocA family oxidoreductase [Micromonospora sp. NBC_01813]WSA06601.1 Gfo/Idh/MocA family oxidoreductase [Micromonospora sp. NBC_01813]
MTTEPPRVALIGANGHGLWHRRQIAPLHDSGALRLVGLVDVRPVGPAPDAPIPAGVEVLTDHRRLLARTRPDVVVICTPPYTHLPIALDALAAGADLLLEKPPVLSLDEHRRLAAALARHGRVCQVGFQALGSAALAELTAAATDGRLGTVTGISTVASWQRDDAYYRRSPWAGRRTVDGRPSLDGALANPLAHATMQCLAVAGAVDGSPPVLVELERYRVRPIEVDDTASMRITLESGLAIVVAVTLAGEDFVPGEVLVHGTAGTAVLEYPTDRLRLPAEPTLRPVPGRVGLLENLLAHRRDPVGVPLIAPLARTEPFTGLLEVVQAAVEPQLVGAEHVVATGVAGTDRVVTIKGINAMVRRAAAELSLFSELDVAWAVRPQRTRLDREVTAGG